MWSWHLVFLVVLAIMGVHLFQTSECTCKHSMYMLRILHQLSLVLQLHVQRKLAGGPLCDHLCLTWHIHLCLDCGISTLICLWKEVVPWNWHTDFCFCLQHSKFHCNLVTWNHTVIFLWLLQVLQLVSFSFGWFLLWFWMFMVFI